LAAIERGADPDRALAATPGAIHTSANGAPRASQRPAATPGSDNAPGWGASTPDSAGTTKAGVRPRPARSDQKRGTQHERDARQTASGKTQDVFTPGAVERNRAAGWNCHHARHARSY
jgi:hypothetical protein